MSDLPSPPPSAPGSVQEFGVHPRWRSAGVTVVKVAGEVNLLSAPALLEAARNQLAAGCHTLVLDLAGVSFCSARGIGTLVKIRQLAEQYEAVVRLAHPSEQVLRIADLTHTREVIDDAAPPDLSRLDPEPAARAAPVAAARSGQPRSSCALEDGDPTPPAPGQRPAKHLLRHSRLHPQPLGPAEDRGERCPAPPAASNCSTAGPSCSSSTTPTAFGTSCRASRPTPATPPPPPRDGHRGRI